MRAERRRANCLNCAAPTPGDFCGACGQRNDDLRAPFWAVVSDLLEEAFEADSRLGRSVAPFLLRPGFLTREHKAGRRVRYSSPLRLYLFCSFAFFLALSFEKLEPDLRVDLDGEAVRIRVVSGGDGRSRPRDGGLAPATSSRYAAAVEAAARGGGPSVGDDLGELVDRKLRARVEALSRLEGERKEEFNRRFAAEFLAAVPKLIFALLPLYALLLQLLFWRRRRFYVEHLTFAFHVHAFTFLVLLLPLLVGGLWVSLATVLAIQAYVLVALHGVYEQSWPRTFLKYCVLGVAYAALMTGGLAVALMVGLLSA